ncbi:MAG TPA: response regulator [Candidatus Dormibacteraeota bacterium]|jgi:CheY-like chemotaxis protein|nr:response regulator [Candidatus Dormibacteraeota bacterium]
MPSAEPLRVLVVEDDQLVRTFLRYALEKDGLAVVEAHDGAAALDAARGGGVDAILVDGLLPDMHGVALADMLLDDPATAALPICFLSGAVLSRRHGNAGFGCLSKPVRPALLVGLLRDLVAWREQGGSTPEQRRAALRTLENGFLVGP